MLLPLMAQNNTNSPYTRFGYDFRRSILIDRICSTNPPSHGRCRLRITFAETNKSDEPGIIQLHGLPDISL